MAPELALIEPLSLQCIGWHPDYPVPFSDRLSLHQMLWELKWINSVGRMTVQ